MNKKKIILIVILALFLLLGCGGVYYYFSKQDSNSTLTVVEKQWIEDNKNDIIDLSLMTDVPVFSYEGNGLLFEFVSDLENATGLEFNKLSYSSSNKPNSDYSFMLTDKKNDNDILIYQDNYAILTKSAEKKLSLSDISVMTVGVLETDLERANSYLKANGGISFVTYKDVTSMLTALKDDKIQGVVLPKMLYFNDIASSYELNIGYNITEMTQDLVLRLGDNKKLNNIFNKYYKKWYKEKYTSVFNEYFANSYFNSSEIYESKIVNFKSKTYVYGFVSNAPFDSTKKNKLIGINSEIIKSFSKIADIDITFNEYSNISNMINAFNENKIDFFLNNTSNSNYAIDVYETTGVFDGNIAIATNINNNITINSVSSLIGKTVYTLEDTKIVSSLSSYDINLKTYSTIDDLLNSINNDSIVVIDKLVFNTYSRSLLKDFEINYIYTLDNNYGYVIRDISDNEIFSNFFDFYLTFINEDYYINQVNYKDFSIAAISVSAIIASIALVVVGILGVIILLSKKSKPKKKQKGVTKENKIKYIDQLTSLKNRNFLNDSIKKWDDSDIYPQTIIIIDLNNVAYINDNYGHEEGDKVIIESANILINNQIENSEIVRTNGNEFLIYLVSYDEKQVVSYIRKLSKELKDISHGFGAAVGYSMINDAIKTIDDAINEATLDMRNNKEESQN